VHNDSGLLVDESLRAVVELNARLPNTYGALMMMQVAGADMPAAALLRELRQSVARAMGVPTADVMFVRRHSSYTEVDGGRAVADAVVVLVVPVHPDQRSMADTVVQDAETRLVSLMAETDPAVTACREPTMLWAATFHGDSSVYLPNSQMESDTIMAEVPLDLLPQKYATVTLAGEIAAAVAAVAQRPVSDVEVRHPPPPLSHPACHCQLQVHGPNLRVDLSRWRSYSTRTPTRFRPTSPSATR
jgi:hypothetical protein